MTIPMKVIPVQLAQATLEYLAGQPYREVAGLIQALSRLPDVEQGPPAPIVVDKRGEQPVQAGSSKEAGDGVDR